MKLLLALISSDDCDEACSQLVKNLINSEKISTVRSFFGPGTTTLVIPVPDKQVDKAIAILKDVAGVRRCDYMNTGFENSTSPVTTTEEGGGSVFVLDVEKFVRL